LGYRARLRLTDFRRAAALVGARRTAAAVWRAAVLGRLPAGDRRLQRALEREACDAAAAQRARGASLARLCRGLELLESCSHGGRPRRGGAAEPRARRLQSLRNVRA